MRCSLVVRLVLLQRFYVFLQHRSAKRTVHALNLTSAQRLDLAHALHFYVVRTHKTAVLLIELVHVVSLTYSTSVMYVHVVPVDACVTCGLYKHVSPLCALDTCTVVEQCCKWCPGQTPLREGPVCALRWLSEGMDLPSSQQTRGGFWWVLTDWLMVMGLWFAGCLPR